MTAEERRLGEVQARTAHWRRWGPYLSERQWGTVREDYSANGTAWDYFPHDHARSRAYRWGEDGLLGISDNHQRLCFALALWNEKDPILKERMFGLTGSQGNHGEDVKDYYFYLDSTPTHSYMKGLYKYPQGEFPYVWLVDENQRRGRREAEFELVDTGVFESDRYFDVVTEYAKAAPDDLLIRITVTNLRRCISSPLSGAETRGRGNPGPFDPGSVLRRWAGKRASLSSTRNWGGPTGCTATAIRHCSSRRTTPISTASTGSRTRAHSSRTAFTSTSSMGRSAP